MVTELEFQLTQILGEPTRSLGNGESYWHCPQCDKRKFHTRPHKHIYRDSYSCWVCDLWGTDLHNVLRARGIGDMGERNRIIDELHTLYEREVQTEAAAAPNSTGETGSNKNHVCLRCRVRDAAYNPAADADSSEADRAFAAVLNCLKEPTPLPETMQTAETVALHLIKNSRNLCRPRPAPVGVGEPHRRRNLDSRVGSDAHGRVPRPRLRQLLLS